MEQLRTLIDDAGSAKSCAGEILDAVPVVLQFIRAQMRRHSRSDLSVPQFRTLVFLDRSPGSSLSTLAEFLGLSPPATSRLVEGLVRKRYVVRRTPSGNRRIVALALSTNGRKSVRIARRAAETRLAEVIASLPARECAAMQRSLRILREKIELVSAEANSSRSPQSCPNLERRKR